MELFKFKKLSQYSNIEHFVTNRVGGKSEHPYRFNNMSLETTDFYTVENRKLLAEKIGLSLQHFVYQYQTHTKNVTIITNEHQGRGVEFIEDAIQENDAMITSEREICLVVMAADCVPILLYDSGQNIIAAVHAGWKGTVQRIVFETVQKMIEKFNSAPQNIIAGIGPSIGECCYEIGNDAYEIVSKNLQSSDEFLKFYPDKQKFHLDLWLANKLQLIDAGLVENNIEIANICTKCNNDLYYSARCNDLGRFSAGIYLKS